MKVKSWTTGIILALMLMACHKDKPDKGIDMGYGFFPLKLGQWIEYDVDSINIDGVNTDTTSWVVRETIDTSFLDNTGQQTFLIHRTWRHADSLEWPAYYKVWSATVNENQAEKVEDNIRYIKLVFPVEDGKTWNGNSLNNLGVQDYQYHVLPIETKNSGQSFFNTVIVLHQDQTTLISKDYEDEMYARSFGMVSSTKIHIKNLQSELYKYGTIVNCKLKDLKM
ncbi:MAG: hypothetical protein NTU44_12070 [Bacteroidetes bacterium]|nr:hypothetical protein [Bacteroidota bacterium]